MATNTPAAPMPSPPSGPVSLETPIRLTVSVQGVTRKFKLPLGDLNAQVLPGKLRDLLNVPEGQPITFERFSDSAGTYVTLDPSNTSVYKSLFRAAKAKLKLRLRASYPNQPFQPITVPGAFAAAFPEFSRFGSETTLNTANTEPTMAPRATGSAETLVPVASAETSKTDLHATPQSVKRVSSRMNRETFFAELNNLSRQRELAFRNKEPVKLPATAHCSWSVFCNECDKPMADSHYHCNVCDEGDYDLCETCVNSGVHCPGDNHWLVKRFVKDGQVVSSTTERLCPKQALKEATEGALPEMPGAFTEHTDEKKPVEVVEQSIYEATRTCNCCVKEDAEARFVTCVDCPDYDLCIPCHEANNHGHHPAHKLRAVGEEPLSPLAEFLCAPGRNAKHNALCDGCDKPIFGTRHKCLNCPDWDYCTECFKNASHIHPGHRFAPLYEPISSPRYRKARHVGIFCDGPLCENKNEYIEGTRYKCAICHDTDFCANCEAYPHTQHNHTHPLIQFKTPVRNATITTVHEDQYGRSLAPKGDRGADKAESSKIPANAATQVQTIIDVKPAEAPVFRPSKEKIEIKDLLAEPIQEKIKVQDLLSSPVQDSKRPFDITKLNAVFVRETIPDGTVVSPETTFTQVWTLRNSGSAAWPAGCSVRYTGGDNMLGGNDVVLESNIIDRSVQVGEEVSFRVPLKAPAHAGTKISYWRLKTSDGQAFGHRLWCHVTVAQAHATEAAAPPAELPVRQAASPWKDTFLQQALQHRLERAQAIEKQRIGLEQIKARVEARTAAEAQAKSHRAEMLRRLSSEVSAVETQHKARVAAAKAALDAARAAKAPVSPVSELPAAGIMGRVPYCQMPAQSVGWSSPPPPPPMAQSNNTRLQEYQAQLTALEEKNKQRRTQQQPSSPVPFAESSTTAAEKAHFMQQLMLLEQQNRKRVVMEQQAKLRQEHAEAARPTVPAPNPAPVEVEAEVRPVTVEDVVDEEDVKPENKSTMIFPKLDKESPVSSTADVSAAPASAPSIAKSEKSESEIFEDAESVSFVESSDEDEGFLTDEEYDILDASDEDFAA